MSEAVAVASDTAASPDAHRSTVVVVVGAGRSGTSAVTRGVASLGVDLGAHLRAGSGKNPTGFFEDLDILAISRQVKRTLGIRGHSLSLIDDAAWDTPAMQAVRDDAVRRLAPRFGDTPLWGYKYGRTLRTLPVWESVHAAMGLDVRYVVALRNPLSVARSRAKMNPQRGRQVWSDLEWLVNVVPYFRQVMARSFTVVDFDRLVADPRGQLERVAGQLGLTLGDAEHRAVDDYATRFLQRDRPSSRFSLADLETDPAVNRWTAEGYSLLAAVAADELDAQSEAFRARWSAVEQAVQDLRPLLAEFDHLRDRAVRAGWNPLSPLDEARQVWRDFKSR